MKLDDFGEHYDRESIILLNGKSSWVRIRSEANSVEGKLHRPEYGSQKLIIFEPGFPGDASTRLEKLWLDALLKNNFTIFAIRHNGTIINGKHSSIYLNCPEKQERAKRENQLLLGSKVTYTIADWLIEPLVALEVFAPKFDGIYLVGHSFGGLAIFYSLIVFSKKQPHLAKKVERLVSLAGSTGKVKGENDPILEQWSEYLRRDSTKERVVTGNPHQNLKILKEAYVKIHNEAKLIPKSTDLICVMVENDELVLVNEAKDIIKALGRGYLIIDEAEEADEKAGRLAHDMDNLPPEKFLNFVNIAWKPEGKSSTLE